MKVIDKIKRAEAEDRCYWSFEFFPPKTPQGVINLYDRMERMYGLGPEFVDVTWGAGGTTSDLTMEICQTAQMVYGLETCMHLTCTNMPKEKIDVALQSAKAAGIQNILALRGDPPRGQENWTKCDNGFAYAVDLVRYIRQEYGDYFCISVAGYPEGHIENPDRKADLLHLKEKIDAGADYIVTQLFYDCDIFMSWVNECREIGILCPIVPGIMPIQSYGGFKRMTTLCKTIVPQFISEGLEPIKDDDAAVKEFGVRLAIDMCNKLRHAGLRGFHFYTLNLEKSVRLILEGLEFVAPLEVARPLPWNPSLAKNREQENVRPIFWKNRMRSYIMRTESWDDFPNGRWGDSRSPAYGDLDGWGTSLKYSKEESMKMWGLPASLEDVHTLFTRYCNGELQALPWSDSPLCAESDIIRDNLARINAQGYLTINSQPPVDGVPSSDRVYGWGPKNGYVYQKAYLEFFVSPQNFERLVNKMSKFPCLTFHAVSKQGELRTNVVSEEPNAVTWGVFPGKEIAQPTIVEGVSFLAWKDEAFDLWARWAEIYETTSVSRELIEHITNSWYLMNIVDNDFKAGSTSIFDIFKSVEEDKKGARQSLGGMAMN